MNKNKIMLKVQEVIEKHRLRTPVDLNKILKREEIELKKINESEIRKEIWAFLIPKNFQKFNNKKTIILIFSCY